MLVRTSSGNTSVGHLSHTPAGFSKLHRPDVSFSCGGLFFPVHSILLAASSSFFTEFFAFIHGQHPEVISLDAVKCEALGAVSLAYFLEFVYSGALPAFDAASDAVELLRLAAFFNHGVLTAQLCSWLAGQLGGMSEEAVLDVFRAAVDLKQRRLVTECLVLLLPQFGRCTSDATVAAVVEHMDAALSKVVLTQLAMQGASPPGGSSPLRRTSSGGDSSDSSDSIALSPLSCGGRGGGSGCFEAAVAAEQHRMKQQVAAKLAASGWGK